MIARKLVPLAHLIAAGGLQLAASGIVPRPSPEFMVQGPAASEIRLSNYKGKVVLVEFLITNCPHCWRVAETIEKLGKDLGPHGFQPIGVALDSQIAEPAVTDFVRRFRLTYPVGYTSSGTVDGYLGRTEAERLQVPQIVVIDREGIIRAQSRPVGEAKLESEAYLRNFVQALLEKRGQPVMTDLPSHMRASPALVPIAVLIVAGGLLAWRNQKKHKVR
ncbi:MAG TPA: TlpA disulfide reductase family protein [Bryobacteraceae bacterium]|nr:TlpA disulfide reductase family protein [Bryobacteraceae bacterium]